MSKKYRVEDSFTHPKKGLLPVGAEVRLTDAEAKYLKHALTDLSTVPAPGTGQTALAAPETTAAMVVEKLVEKHSKHDKKH